MYKNIFFIITITSLHIYTHNNTNGLDINITNLKDIKQEILFASTALTGALIFYRGADYCMKENQNKNSIKKYIVPGGFTLTGISLLLFSHKICKWLIKK